MAKIEIVEVGPRDGLQNERTPVSTATKLAFIESLVHAGARRIEAVSFVRPDRVPQMADAEGVMAAVPRRAGVRYSGLVVNERGFHRALAAGIDEVNVVVVATETFSQRNQGKTIAETLDIFTAIARLAHANHINVTATVAASFGCPFEGEVPPERVIDIARRCAEDGASEIALADTIGVAVPRQVGDLLAAIRGVSSLPLRCHFHNTRNTGYANALAAADAGVGALDASSGGIGGCPFAPAATGNIATEDLVYALSRTGFDTGLDVDRLMSASDYIATHLGSDNPGLLRRAGWFPPADIVGGEYRA